MTDLNALIERLSRATGRDPVLGREVLRACGWRKTCVGQFHGPMFRWSSPDFKIGFDDDKFHDHDPTSSMDAAISLIPRPMCWNGGEVNEDDQPWACITDSEGADYAATGATPIIALCIAALSARTRSATGKIGAEDDSIQKASIDAEQSVTKPSPATGGDS